MTLGEFISSFRETHDNMSIRSFAALSGVSPQQISNIEKGIGNDGKPMTSSMRTYAKIAAAVGMSERDFLNMLNDNVAVNRDDSSPSLVSVKEPLAVSLMPDEALLLERLHSLNEAGQKKLLDYSLDLVSSGRYSKKDRAVS